MGSTSYTTPVVAKNNGGGYKRMTGHVLLQGGMSDYNYFNSRLLLLKLLSAQEFEFHLSDFGFWILHIQN